MLENKRSKVTFITVFFIYLSVVTVFSQGQAALKADSASGYQGDKVKITITIDEPENISGLQFSVKYDKNKLDVTEEDIVRGNSLKGWLFGANVLKNDGEIKFACASGTAIQEVESIEACSINFTIKPDAEMGKTYIVFDSIIAGDGTNELKLASSKGDLTILQISSSNKPKATYSKPSETVNFQTPAPASSTLKNDSGSSKVEPDSLKPANIVFKDMDGHWAVVYIEDLYKRGVLLGNGDGRVKPDDEISRAEAIVLLVKSIKSEPAKEFKLKFRDESSLPAWSKGFIQTAYDNALISGYDDNTIRAGNKLTRAEMAVLVMKAFKLEQAKKTELNYKDSESIPFWSKNYIESASNLGIITGYSDNTLRPNKFITRAEMFKIISKCLEKMP